MRRGDEEERDGKEEEGEVEGNEGNKGVEIGCARVFSEGGKRKGFSDEKYEGRLEGLPY